MRILLFASLIILLSTLNAQTQLTIKAPNGDVGVGTDDPQSKLDVRGNILMDNPTSSVSSISGNGDNKRIVVSNNTNSLTSRAFFSMFGNNPTNRAGEFVFGGTYLRFLNNVNNGTFGTEGMRLTSTGRLGIGITSPASLLHVNGQIMNAGGVVTSDKRLKKDIKKYKAGIEAIMQIEPYTYYYNGEAGIKTKSMQVGIMAQDFEKIAPYAVSKYTYEERNHANQLKDSKEYMCANTDVIMYMLVNSIKEQQEIIQKLEEKVEALRLQMIENNTNETPVSTEKLNNDHSNFLGQCYPNPNNGIFSIDYRIQQDIKNAKIEIFDINGKLIKSKKLEKHNGTIDININGLARGVYNYSLNVDGNNILTKSLIFN